MRDFFLTRKAGRGGRERSQLRTHASPSYKYIFQRHWEWQEDRRTDLQPGFYRYNTVFMASLDVKTAFDVAEPSVVSRILTLTGVHGHLTAALLAEVQDVRRSACFENTETEFSGVRGAFVNAVGVLWRWRGSSFAVGVLLWKAEKCRAKRWGLPFGGQHDNEYVLRGMMWADNCWLFCDNERLTCTVNEIIEELVDLDMGPCRNRCAGQALTNMRI